MKLYLNSRNYRYNFPIKTKEGNKFMHYFKPITVLSLTSSLFLFNACTPKETPLDKGGYYHSNIYFGVDLSDSYQKGIKDGCTTAKGNYKKSHQLFKNDKDYNNGWFLGRNKCKNLLIIDENE